jgi:plastocyanin
MSPSRLLPLLLCCLTATASARVAAVDVSAQVQVIRQGKLKQSQSGGQSGGQTGGSGGVVVWLVPLASSEASTEVSVPAAKPEHFRMAQKDKQFTPHLLVIPTGSTVDFPNLDPFFHNVFSLFDGKRFDLGLYEAGSTRTVHFDHEGVSYIFCNIHPEMSAVVVALSTPYAGVSSPDGSIELHGVPPGMYDMKVWAEGSDAKQLEALSRRVRISPSQPSLGDIRVVEAAGSTSHKNKFGQDYKPADTSLY